MTISNKWNVSRSVEVSMNKHYDQICVVVLCCNSKFIFLAYEVSFTQSKLYLRHQWRWQGRRSKQIDIYVRTNI